MLSVSTPPAQLKLRPSGRIAPRTVLRCVRCRYERDVLPFVGPFSEALAESLRQVTIEGTTHFDHGSGTGEVLRVLATPQVAARVVALEPNSAMISRFKELFAGLSSVSLFEGTLDGYLSTRPSARADEAFDLVTSQLVLPFVPDPFREL
jgi:ubiquinone/menaquinone biosynthesis C-methylase UbiE